tara:strand:+ start:78 stop:302 length:225 start_codon:yes stop_codon:yes gene_type:complete
VLLFKVGTFARLERVVITLHEWIDVEETRDAQPRVTRFRISSPPNTILQGGRGRGRVEVAVLSHRETMTYNAFN